MEDKQLFLDVYSVMSRFAESLYISGRQGDANAVMDLRNKLREVTFPVTTPGGLTIEEESVV